MSKELIRLQDLVMEFDGERILDGINLYINDHEFLTLLGPSGCGKTTTLRIIGGFLNATSGNVLFDGQMINDLPLIGRHIVDDLAVKGDGAGGGRQEAADDPQCGGFAAAGRSQQREEFMVFNVEIDSVENTLPVELHAKVLESDEFLGHYPPPFL